ncbi:MAG: hypothetical protein ACYTBS_06145 [Planctomycetota bacterium]|jgi:hypothetical protein
MKRSTTLLLVAAAVSCTLAVAFGKASEGGDISDPPLQVGRFLLESGEYLAPSHAAERRLPGIFKIDTATGRVWRYAANVADKQKIEKWVLISG